MSTTTNANKITTVGANAAPATATAKANKHITSIVVSEDGEQQIVNNGATPTMTDAHEAQCGAVAEVAGIDVGVAASVLLVGVQEAIITDSGRESMNECDSSLEDAGERTTEQLSKKPCTAEFYTSSGSQTIWYLTADEVVEVQKEKNNATTNLFPRVAATNDSVGSKNVSLSQQMRAVSSPSLTETAQTTPLLGGVLPATATQLAAADENAGAAAGSSAVCGSQSVGVLQKFKRTLTNFSKPPQSQPQASDSAASASVVSTEVTPTAAATNSAQFYTGGSSGGSGGSLEAPNDPSDSASGKYRFGQLIWRSSKERRKTKHDRRGKCNSGDSGIQVELENDDQFARVLGASMHTSAAVHAADRVAMRTVKEHSLRAYGVRRVNSAKVSASSGGGMSSRAHILRRIEASNEREAPESLPTRSLSQPNGLETFGISKADLDESDSDSVTSHDECPSYYSVFAEVLYNFSAASPQELGLERGALIEVLRKEVGPWWFGRIKKEDASLVEEILDPELGWFPKEFVRVIQCPEVDPFFLNHMSAQLQGTKETDQPTTATTTAAQPDVDEDIEDNDTTVTDADATVDENNVTTIIIESPSTNEATSSTGESSATATPLVPSRSVNVIIDNAELLRRSAVKELLDTEVNYVKLLASICEGYLPVMSKRIDIFTPHSIRLIFSNISTIYKFQRRFLGALRKGIEQNQIAKVFLTMHKEFLCYSTYCNAYPRALIELETYDRVKEAKIIFDNCRESENLAELPLSAHLLAPVQRICRYPLHLGEIMKAVTKGAEEQQQSVVEEAHLQDWPDNREAINMALESMKGITEAVNEGKRHSETIARHQASFQNFKGPPLYLHSTRFFLQIDATRQKQNLWNSSYTLFLFDNQLVYCKRDIIKRSHFIYKGRIFLDRCRVVNVRDGKMFGHTIKNSLRIYCEARDKWYDFSFRSANRKHRFLSTLALERQFGGKALYVAEMTGYEYAFDDRDYSDQSDYDMPESEVGNGGSLAPLRFRECIYDVTNAAGAGTTSTSGGESSVPDSPAKSGTHKYSDTLPKKSQTREGGGGVSSSVSGGCGLVSVGVVNGETSSLGRRRLGNWFRKPKSTNSTPTHSPTHRPTTFLSTGDLQIMTSTVSANDVVTLSQVEADQKGAPVKESTSSSSA